MRTYRLGVDNYTTEFSSLTAPGSSVKDAWQKGMLSETHWNFSYVNSNFMLNFHKTFGEDWDGSLVLGSSTEDTYVKSNSARAENFSIPSSSASITPPKRTSISPRPSPAEGSQVFTAISGFHIRTWCS